MSPPPRNRLAAAVLMSQARARADLGRAWSRIAGHPSHNRCWGNAAGSAHAVYPTPNDGRFDIGVRRTTPANTRVVGFCRDRLSAIRVPVPLRAKLRQD